MSPFVFPARVLLVHFGCPTKMNLHHYLDTTHQRSCGKVMFSVTCVHRVGHVTITHDTSDLRKQDSPVLGPHCTGNPQHPQTLDTNPLLRPPLQVTSGGIHWWNTFLLYHKPINIGSVHLCFCTLNFYHFSSNFIANFIREN